MADANTPVSPQPETTKGENIDTLAVKPTEDTTPSVNVDELKGTVENLTNNLKRQETIAKTAQKNERQALREKRELEIELAKAKRGDAIVEPNKTEDDTASEREVKMEAKIGIQGLLLDNPDYQELLSNDITLKEVLKNNPFALIGDFFDAQDAVEQIKEKLDSRVATLKSQHKDVNKTDENKGKVFEPGPINIAQAPLAPKPATAKVGIDKTEESIRGKITYTE
jgi:chaperonin cofactor prefoldin